MIHAPCHVTLQQNVKVPPICQKTGLQYPASMTITKYSTMGWDHITIVFLNGGKYCFAGDDRTMEEVTRKPKQQ